MTNINKDEIESFLITIFTKKFNLNKDQALIADIKSVDSWDSLSHMDLIMELQEVFKLTDISADNFANLTSFSKVLDYIKNENT
jgi:acyl carrier protein